MSYQCTDMYYSALESVCDYTSLKLLSQFVYGNIHSSDIDIKRMSKGM